MARCRLFFHSHSNWNKLLPTRSKSCALWDHPERLIALKSSAWCRHLYESTGRSGRHNRCEVSLRGNVESRRCAIERNGSSASESLAQDFNRLSDFCGGGTKPDERREAGA